MKRFFAVIAVCLACATFAAADTLWTLNNVVFSGPHDLGNTATGSFTVDDTVSFITSWDITVSGTNTAANYHYTSNPNDSGAFLLGPNGAAFFEPSFAAQFLVLDTDGTGFSVPGTTVNLLLGNEPQSGPGTIACEGCSILVSGTVSSVTATPEPGSMLLLGTGIFGLAGIARRKLRK